VERYRVGDLVVDARAAVVSRAGHAISLPPLTFNLLMALVREAPQLVRRDDLLSSVWPGEFVSDETLSQRVRLLRRALGDESDKPRYIASVRGWGYKLIPSVEAIPVADEPIRALAVLPLADLTAGSGQEYLADGLTDALLTSLAKLGALKVISRTSTMRYRQADKPLARIAQELGVQALVEGSVLRSGCRVWITVQLVRAATGEHIWAESYERDVTDVPALLDEVAATIADAIRIAVTPDERARLARQGKVDPVAYDTFLKGLWHLSKYTRADVDRAIALFDEAIARDPAFSFAYAGLAASYVMRAGPLGGGVSAAEERRMMARGKAAAEQAVEIDNSLAVGYTMLGEMALFHDWDWRRAVGLLERAIHLGPSFSWAHLGRALVAACLMERDIVHSEGKRAIELDPFNLAHRVQYAECQYWIREYNGAIQHAQDALAFEPSYPRAHFVLGRVYESQGRISEAIRHYVNAGLITTSSAEAAGRAFKREGARGFHRWALKVGLGSQGGLAAGTGRRRPLRPIWEAKLHSRAGNIDEAIEWLERAYADRESLLVLLKADVWDPLRGDPRFQDLVRRIGIP